MLYPPAQKLRRGVFAGPVFLRKIGCAAVKPAGGCGIGKTERPASLPAPVPEGREAGAFVRERQADFPPREIRRGRADPPAFRAFRKAPSALSKPL